MNIDEDVRVFVPKVHGDERGEFFESYSKENFDAWLGRTIVFVQDNQSTSSVGAVRGLHYQMPPKAQAKLVRVSHGAVFDVAVDIRRQSPTFGEWRGLELSENNGKQLWIPVGFAHGFAALTDGAQVQYKTTQVYSPAHERAIRWDDPAISIRWPIDGALVRLGSRDAAAPRFLDAEVFEEGDL